MFGPFLAEVPPDEGLPPAWLEPQDSLDALEPEVWPLLDYASTAPGCFAGLAARARDSGRRIGADYLHYYTPQNFARVGAGLAVGGLLANTAMDQNFRNWYQDHVHDWHANMDGNPYRFPRVLGDGAVMLPIFAGAALAGCAFEDSPAAGTLGIWGGRSLRSLLVGWPPLWLVQYGVGGSRPGESPAGSDWKPFQDNNGVSGHAFMGAVPFLVAADMTDRPLLKAGFYFLSTWAGVGRIDDDGHYLSQVLLGWWMAWLATDAVSQTELAARHIQVFPVVIDDTMGLGVEYRW